MLIAYSCIHFVSYLTCSLHFQDKRNPGTPRPRLFTVGRLDVATTGLIVVTNDGSILKPDMQVLLHNDLI